jgi:hypothetical protein
MSKINLPTEPPTRNLIDNALISDCKSVERAMARLVRLEREMPGLIWNKEEDGLINNPPLDSGFDLAGARQTLAQIKTALDLLPTVMRRAVADEIVTQLALLTACYLNSKGERQIYAQMLSQEVVDLKPTLYALHIGCRRLRKNYKFLPAIAEAVPEFERANRQAKRLKTFDARLTDLTTQLDDFEDDLPRLKKQEAAEVKRKHARLQQQLADMTTPPMLYSDHDLQVLGITREELKRRYYGQWDEAVKRLGGRTRGKTRQGRMK